MSGAWIVRRAGLGDAPAVIQLEAAAFGAQAWGGAAIAEGLSSVHIDTLVIAPAAAPEAPCGFAMWRDLGEEAELLSLGISPLSRGCGAATALIGAVVRSLQQAEKHRLYLEVSAGNLAAIRLYEKTGFIRIGERKRYYRDGADALVMRRFLK